MAIITPYDNKVAVWHHKGSVVASRTIDELAMKIRRDAPAIKQVWVKTSDGSDWMAVNDSKPALAIDGPDAIARWVRTLQKYGLEFHAWCVPRGLNPDREGDLIAAACNVPGVRSMILNVEPYPQFYVGGRASVRPLMTRVRRQVPGAFHIGIAVDPRPQHYLTIFPTEWYPFVGSVHLQLYWTTFENTPEATLRAGYAAWANFGRPLFPVLPGYEATAAQMATGQALAVNTYKATGMSYWVTTKMGPPEFALVNRHLDLSVGQAIPGADGSPVTFGAATTVAPGTVGYAEGRYPDVPAIQGTLIPFASQSGYDARYIKSNDRVANVFARWDPQITRSGWYQIEAYVPNQHATTGRARYKLHGVRQPGETIISFPQAQFSNEWAMLGTFNIDATRPQPGVVFLNDWTFEPNREITFDALRWRLVTSGSGGGDPNVPISTDTPSGLSFLSAITPRARQIVADGRTKGNKANVFTRVGDSITASPYFMTPFGTNDFNLGSFAGELQDVVNFYRGGFARTVNSFTEGSLSAGNGWGADRIIQPGWAFQDVCGNQTPIQCELSKVKPAIALIMIGTNDSGGADQNVYRANLRKIVETCISAGTLPVLSTIPPKLTLRPEMVDVWNTIIKDTAQTYSVPLWDYWANLQNLPNKGLSADGIHPSVPPDEKTGHFTPTNITFGYTMRNLRALQVLNVLWKILLQG